MLMLQSGSYFRSHLTVALIILKCFLHTPRVIELITLIIGSSVQLHTKLSLRLGRLWDS